MALSKRIEVLEARERMRNTAQPIEDEQMECYGLQCQTCADILECPAHRAEVWP